MPKELKQYDINEQLIDFAVHINRTEESLPKKRKLCNSIFVVQHSIFFFQQNLVVYLS